jgi:hypothetical protein
MLRQKDAEMVARHLANEAYEPSIAERQADAKTRVPKPSKLFKNSFALEPIMLKSALFRPAAGERAVYADWTPIRTHGANQVFFKGEELRQDDERVFLTLLKRRTGGAVDAGDLFVPRPFCRDVLGWADSSDSVARLKASLVRLQGGHVHIVYGKGGFGYYSFVSDWHETEDGQWLVLLSPMLAQMFERNPTYLDTKARLALRDGLDTWLYGYLEAEYGFLDSPTVTFPLKNMRELAGSTYVQRDFNKALKHALERLRDRGLIVSFAFVKKSVEVTRKRS